MTSNLIVIALLASAMPLAFCQMRMDTVAYNATVFSDDPNPGSTIFTGYLDKAKDTFFWNFNFSNSAVRGVKSLEIRDGKKDMDVLGKQLQDFSTAPFSGTGNFSGNFSNGINAAVASNATELANHMCMGHIYAVVQTESGSQRAAINYNPKNSGIEDCYDAVGLQGHSMGGDMDMPMENGEMDMEMGMNNAPAPSRSGSETLSFAMIGVVIAATLVAG